MKKPSWTEWDLTRGWVTALEDSIVLKGDSLSYRIGRKTLVDRVSVSIRPGEITAIVGSNGAGKSTLLRLLSGELEPTAGSVELDGVVLPRWPLCECARRRAVLSQHSTLTFGYSVTEVVTLGRMPHARHSNERKDREIVEAALRFVGAESLLHRRYPTLSGGERQRVHLARVLAQIWDSDSDGGRYLLLDEPLSAQDLARQHELMAVLGRVAAAGVGIAVVVHDLNTAARYADEIVMLRSGRLVACGAPTEVVTAERIEAAFGIAVSVAEDPLHGGPWVVAHSLRLPRSRTLLSNS